MKTRNIITLLIVSIIFNRISIMFDINDKAILSTITSALSLILAICFLCVAFVRVDKRINKQLGNSVDDREE